YDPLKELTVSICDALKSKQNFKFDRSNGTIKVVAASALTAREEYKQIRKLALYTCSIFSKQTIHDLPVDQREIFRDLGDSVDKAVRIFKQKYGKIASKQGYCRSLEAKALCIKLGGVVDHNYLKSEASKDFKAFIKANHLHHKMPATGYQMQEDPSLEIEGYGIVQWRDIFRQVNPLRIDHVSQDGTLLFTTDCEKKLTDDYSFISGKIAKYNPQNDQYLRPFDTQPLSENFSIELYTSLDDPGGMKPRLLLGDHSYLILTNPQGERYSTGKLMRSYLGIRDVFAPFSMKKACIDVPDRYVYLPKENRNVTKTVFYVPEDKFQKVLDAITEAKQDPEFSFSILKGNCSSFAASLLSHAGIDARCQMNWYEFLFRAITPAFIQNGWNGFMSSIPLGLKYVVETVAHAFAYLVGLIPGLLVWAWSHFGGCNGLCSDISLFDVLFPWRQKMDHPFAMKRWQDSKPAINDLTGE
ncbi:MAG: hypothetical protein EBZ47_04285, partial [Chlamydiae bacterium]|nr:hypothetical protein [Chlamydiota bacterium]